MTSPLPRLFDQPDTLPAAAWAALQAAVPNERVHRVALVDLDDQQRFCCLWLVLTERHLARVVDSKVEAVELANVAEVVLGDGLSSHHLWVLDAAGNKKLTAHFTRRQSRAVSDLRFVLDALRRGDVAEAPPPAEEVAQGYRDAVLASLDEARGTLSVARRGTLWRLLGYLRPHRKAVTLGFLLATVLTVLQLLPPYLTRLLVDDVLHPVADQSAGDARRAVWTIIGGLALVWCASELTSFVRLRVMALTGEKIATRLRLDIYSHMQTLSLAFFGSRSTGSLITRVSSDTDRLWDFVTFGIIDMVVAVLQVVGVATALFLQDASLACFVLLPLPLMTFMFYWHSRRVQSLYLRIWRKWSALTAVLSDVIPGIRVVKAFAQESQEVERFAARNRALETETETLHRQWTRFWPTVVMLMHTCSLIVWAIGAPRVLAYVQSGGTQGMPLGVFIAFTGYMWSFWVPVQQLGMMSRTLNRVTTSASRVFEVLDTLPTVADKPQARDLSPLRGAVRFDNVTFSYDGVRPVLQQVSFAVQPGELIGLVGPSGGGKTTLINLICRFYDPKSGSIALDGVDVRDLALHSLRRQVGLVLQEPYLFHGTVADNIAYGARDVDLDRIVAAARAANAHDFICGFTDGYETLVGERGQSLSGGERQRISIARAVLHDPRILILDEATSSVDTETESKIQDALDRLVSGRTTFAIAHRLSTLSKADRLFVMERGKLVEEGTHAALLSRDDGVYSRLHRAQVQLQAQRVL